MKQTVTVIYHEVQGKKQYVSELSTREWDDKYLVTYSDKKDNARQFENESEARAKIDRFVNHCGRYFQTQPYEIKLSRKNTFTPRAQDAFIN